MNRTRKAWLMKATPVRIAAGCVLVASAAAVFAEVSQHPKDAGQSMSRNASGNSYEGAYDNPALLGAEKAPKGGLKLAPFTDVGVGYWSDKLYLRPYKALFSIGDLSVDSGAPPADSQAREEELDALQAIVEEIMRESFDLGSMDPDQTTKKLAEELEDGVTFYTGARATLAAFNLKRFGFDIQTRTAAQITLPDAFFYMLLDDVGLLPGNTLNADELEADFIWTTDIRLSLGLPVNIPALHRFFKLDYGAGGVALKYVMGHSYFHAEAEKAKLTYTTNNQYDVDAKVKVQTAGLGMSGWIPDDGFAGPFENGFPLNGHGVGIDAGGILYDDDGSLSISVRDLGVLFWTKNTREQTLQLTKSDLDIYDIIDGLDQAKKSDADGDGDTGDFDDNMLTIFDRNRGEYASTSADSLDESSSFVSVLPITLDIAYVRTWNFTRAKSPGIKFLFEDITVGLNYQQQLTSTAGQSYIPRLSIGTEFGTLRNWIPLRIGMILGGPEHWGSTLGFGINARYFHLDAAYKAVGHVFFVPKRGMELSFGMGFNWGMSTDSDKDGIRDKDDKCPYEPEDKDNFEDEDGCPDTDNDQDGILDTDDKCPNDPEDMDGFEDEDGCPDTDNDQDGILDTDDKCPNDPEDKDNFEDEDGCPDYDNDKDGVPDTTDKCPVLPEDIDSFEDEDGCPDYDNDKDGIPDTLDNCINKPEVFNGFQDADGCPDELPKPTEQEQKVLYTKLAAINFKTGSAELTSASFVHLNFVADFLKKYGHLKYEIQGHTDSQGGNEYNLLLSAARAASVRGYLMQKAVPDSQLISVGYGEERPVADNKTAKGRAMNRRVEFRVIESKEEYEQLKIRSAEFRQRVEGAKIRGAGKYGW